ncbi:hypothetical protein IPZ58_15380 [Streptomyces roseoverticillatus]|uniref:hypothetical protein n=1 Tax=Streptomyces roseoverticillatus TaxID=66429 RepID=UPI001F43EAFE|nr:hypothetical protein [Streptomyces roseoverticillatus]MCF3102962.1 hypothetical protein [Streptomyces roseoverticillatus]
MDSDPDEVLVIELDCDDWPAPYSRTLTRRQLGELLLLLDDMHEETAAAQEDLA